VGFRFETLEIWQMARSFAASIYTLTARFPRHEDYGLRSQMNRAASSVGLNIAEGCGKSSDRALDYHLDIAVGSVFEVVAASYIARDQNYFDEAARLEVYAKAERLAKAINAFRKTLR
jgi:four helix bundle protein